MKKILLSLAVLSVLFTSTAQAHGGWGRGFAVGAVVGGATVYAYNHRPYYYGYHPYYGGPAYVYAPQPVYIQQPYSAGYVQQQILDANCNCYRTVLVPQQ